MHTKTLHFYVLFCISYTVCIHSIVFKIPHQVVVVGRKLNSSLLFPVAIELKSPPQNIRNSIHQSNKNFISLKFIYRMFIYTGINKISTQWKKNVLIISHSSEEVRLTIRYVRLALQVCRHWKYSSWFSETHDSAAVIV